jgi:hypothetical protein
MTPGEGGKNPGGGGKLYGYWTLPGYTGTDSSPGQVFLLPPGAEKGHDQKVTVENVFPAGKAPSEPTSPPYAADFSWQAKDKGNLVITIKGNGNQWRGDAAARAELRKHFAELLVAFDALEYPSGPFLPGATALIARALAEVMPAPIAESLFFYYGMNSGLTAGSETPYVDLVPGMRVVVQPTANQFVGVGSKRNGMVAAGSLTLRVCGSTGSDGHRRVGFDPFLAALAPPQIPNKPVGPVSPQVEISGVQDLQAAVLARRWYRLLLPLALSPAAIPGDAELGDSVTLVGAETRADLEAATAKFQAGEPASGTAAPLVYSIFRGRAAVQPQISVSWGSWPEWVPLGTTVRDFVEQFAFAHPSAWNNSASKPHPENSPFGLTRPVTSPAGNFGEGRQVFFNPQEAEVSDPLVYELPVIQGDRFESAQE